MHSHASDEVRGAARRRRSIPSLLGDQSVEFGFLLHDIGKIAIPDKRAAEGWARSAMPSAA